MEIVKVRILKQSQNEKVKMKRNIELTEKIGKIIAANYSEFLKNNGKRKYKKIIFSKQKNRR